MSVAAPEFGTIYGYVVPAPGGNPSKTGIIWNHAPDDARPPAPRLRAGPETAWC